MINSKPCLPLTNPPTTAPEKKEKTQDKQKDQVTNYYPSSLIYIPSYEEEDAPNLVDNLIPMLTESEWDSDYSYSYQKEHNYYPYILLIGFILVNFILFVLYMSIMGIRYLL